MSFCEAFSLKAARERVFYHTGRVKSRLKWYEIVTSEPIFVLSRQLKGSSPVSSYLFVFLYRCKETQKVHQHFQAFLRAKSKKSGFGEVDRLLRSPILLGFARFLPKMQKKTPFAVVDKRRFFYGCGSRIRTQTYRVRVCCATLTQIRNEHVILYTSDARLSRGFQNFFIGLQSGKYCLPKESARQNKCRC